MKSAHLLLLCVLAALLVVGIADQAQAKDDVSADQDLAQSKGLGSKEIDASKMPGALEYAIVIGSIIAAIGVIKFV